MLVAAVIVAGAVWWAAQSIVREVQAGRAHDADTRTAQLMQTFAPGVAAAQADPRALLTSRAAQATARTTPWRVAR